jgi:hypothetical protein
VSVDQPVSPTEGFIPTHRGTPTTKRYTGAMIFVDHYSDFTYTHLMVGEPTGETTVEAKLAFERVAEAHGVKIKHYHSDNGLFDTKAFKNAIILAKQTLSFCGPNDHHQNGKAENRIKTVTTGGRTALLHATHQWPKAINASLWPAGIKNYTNFRNSMPTKFTKGAKRGKKQELPHKYEDSPLSRFSGTAVETNLDHFHPFGSPVYILEGKLQAQHAFNKWKDHSKVGIFLCHSPEHALNVPLVLNTQTGNVVPQFHCIYDNEFTTCRRSARFESLWQMKAKLMHVQMDRVARVTMTNTKLHDTPASDHKLLDNDPDAAAQQQKWNYRSAVGCLSYTQAMIRPDITMAVQQCARFCNDPKQEHEEAVKRICRYLMKTKDKGLTLRPDKTRGLECFVDADWAGSWRNRSCNDPLSVHSRTG